MNRSRITLLAIVIVVGALLGGLMWGRSGRGALEQARRSAELGLDLERARVSILHGRLELFGSNFGAASQQFDRARAPLQSAQQRLTDDDRDAEAARVAAALATLAEAQTLSLALSQDADAKASAALKEIDAIK